MMTDWYDDWKKKSEAYKPAKETDQGVLWLKQMALMSPHFKEVREGKSNVSEAFLNACMQMAYDMGTQRIDEKSYDRGYQTAWNEVADKLGFELKE
jgi:hypothetical protein